MSDAFHILRLEKGQGESVKEKFDRMARERIGGGGKSVWWDQ